MTEKDFMLATDVARLMAAREILINVMPSERVPEAEYRQVMSTIFGWQSATLGAIHVRRDEEVKEPAP